MISFPALAIDSLNLSSAAAPVKKTTRLPLSLRLIECLACCSAIAAVATIIYGLVTNIFAFMIIGGIFAAATLTSFYLIHRSAQLKDIEDDTLELNKLNDSLVAKDARIEQLIAQLKELNNKLHAQENEAKQTMLKDQELQKQSDERLREAIESLTKAQADTQTAQEQTTKDLFDQIQAMENRSKKDQQLIINLNTTIKEAREQIDHLENSLADLQKQLAVRPEQRKEKAMLDAGISQQIKILTAKLKTSPGAATSARARGLEIDKQIALQTKQIEKTSLTITRIDALLTAISERLPQC